MSTNKTLRYLSKYERAALLATRAAEIADGLPITIPNPGTTNPTIIAEMEFNAGKTPKRLWRTFPDGSTEKWSLSAFKEF